MGKTALITGASSGIGLELARIHASKGDNLILVARSRDKLESLQQELQSQQGINVHIIEKDLSMPGSAESIYSEVHHHKLTIDYLVNNAGFGDYGFFTNTSWEKEQRMIFLNIDTLTRLTKLFLCDMVDRGHGRIMNLSSVAGLQPGPGMAVYSATKAYVLSFSEAINHEVRKRGVTVTSLCPGPSESGFKDTAAAGNSKMFSKKLPTAKEVAAFGYKAMMKGKAVAIHGPKFYWLSLAARFAPRALVVKLSAKIMESRD